MGNRIINTGGSILIVFAAIMLFIGNGCASKNYLCKSDVDNYTIAGMKLWENNCQRCHNTPNPDSYSDAEWEVIGSHMRIRAYLTKEETEKIISFLKTIN